MRSLKISATGKAELISKWQTATEIAQQMKRAEYESRVTSKKLSSFFKSSNQMKTCKLVWLFLRKKINYQAEPKSNQTAKTIGRFIVDGFGDCKHFATTSVGVLNACGIPAWFVLVSQNKRDKTPTHAYCCAMVNNQVVVIDPCRKEFNTECSHYFKYQIAPIKK